jgi:hypothetical protein
VAGLGDDELRQRLVQVAPTAAIGRCRVAALGGLLSHRIAAALPMAQQIDWCGGFETAAELLATVTPGAIDVLLVEAPTLRARQLEQLMALFHQIRPRMLLVTYRFAAERDLRRLDLPRMLLLRAPVDASQLLRIALLSLNMSPQQGPQALPLAVQSPAPERRFSDDALADLATAATSIRCECPHHLSELLNSLNSFERYSGECENADAADAALHALLRNVAGHARALLERALEQVVEHERALMAAR